MEVLTPRQIENEIIGSLLVDPMLMVSDVGMSILPTDFQQDTSKQIHSAMSTLFASNLVVNEKEIIKFLQTVPNVDTDFLQEYIFTAKNIAEPKNFNYNVDLLKKYGLLRDLATFCDISSWYTTAPVSFEIKKEMEEKLVKCTISDILENIFGRVVALSDPYVQTSETMVQDASDGIDALLDSLEEAPDYGVPLFDPVFTTITKGCRKTKLYCVSGGTGVGKALTNDTIIPTPKGFRRVDEIKVGDKLFDRMGQPTEVLGVFPQGEKEVFEVTFADGRTALCNDEHLWSYYNTKGTGLITSTLKEMMQQDIKRKGGWRFQVPVCQAVEYDERKLPIDPYVLGLFLGDGSFREQLSSKSLAYSTADISLIDVICDTMSWTWKKNSKNNFSYSFKNSNNELVYVSHFLKDLPELYNVYSQDKFIPKQYLTASIEQRFALLNGLLDTDGTVDTKGRVSFTTTSPQMKKDIMELIYSLGISCTSTMDKRTDKYTNGQCYTINVLANVETSKKLFRLERHCERINQWANNGKRKETKKSVGITNIKSLGYTTPMTCFMVDNPEHLFLMNDYIVTHNTRMAIAQAVNMSIPVSWDIMNRKWIYSGADEKVGVCSTELQVDEMQTIILATISGVDEDHILECTMTDEEKKRVRTAVAILKKYEGNLTLWRMPDPNIKQIVSGVRRMKLTHQLDALFFDYIHTSPNLIQEYAGQIREDVALLLIVNALKNLANELNLFIWTGTQYNAHGMTDEFVTENCLRGR